MKKHQKLNFVTGVLLLFSMLIIPAIASGQWGATYRLAEKNRQEKAEKADFVPTDEADLPSKVKVGILTDLSQSVAGAGDEQSKINNGKLGVSFVTEHFYGDISFAVLTNDRKSAALNITDTAFFYNNLLLAQHQSGGLNEVSGSIGSNGFLSRWTNKEEGALGWIYSNLGVHVNFRSTNQVWKKDSVATDLLLNAFSADATLQVLNLKIKSETWSHLQLIAYTGWTTRRLGGNYALNSNAEIRKQFLGTGKFVFNGWEYGLRLEVGPFYGQASFSEFNLEHNILGFSGPQMAVKFGALLKLDLEAENLNRRK